MNHYCDMWPRRSNRLAPLTRITPDKSKFKWTKIEKDAFDKINRTVSRYALLTYPDFNNSFRIHTNDSALQLGSVIIHKSTPVALYGRNFIDAQKRYTVT